MYIYIYVYILNYISKPSLLCETFQNVSDKTKLDGLFPVP